MGDLARRQMALGAIALSLMDDSRPTLQPYHRAALKSPAPTGPTPKRAKSKAARKQRRKKK